MEEIMVKCQVNKTHFAYIFVDKTGSKKLPSPFFLAMFKIVITTTNRFSSEWRNGSFEDELKRKSSISSGDEEDSEMEEFFGGFSKSEEACPLLKVNWLRMIVDEGHSMGKGKDNSSISFASWINAERRWAMTGTPTRRTMTQSGLSSILNLMQYLQHGFFSRRLGGDVVWSHLIVRGWNRGLVSSFFRLRSLLSLLMVRHTKSDIEELPPPIFKVNVLPMSLEEVTTYNTLVCAVQSNLVITSMKGKTSGAQDSLLHKSQIKHAREAISNLRLVCVGGTQVRPTLTPIFWDQFLADFDKGNEDKDKRKEIRDFISRATTGQLSQCACCQMMLSTLLVFPCGHLVCTECVDNSTTSCLICEKEFDVDAFQRLQPGFVYEWLHNIEEEKKLRSPNTGQDGGNNNIERHNDNQDVVVPPLVQGVRTNKPGDGHVCVFSPQNPDGVCRLCLRHHEDCYLVEEERQCRVCFRFVEECPSSETKPHYIINKLLKLYKQQEIDKATLNSQVAAEYGMDRKRPLKVIVFSQFRKILDMTGDRLLRRFGSGCVAEYWGMYRRKELSKFVKDEKCFCMLLGKDGSEGLDLSFVTHIIFLEQVWDKSLESQAVSRAWRMGAKGSVQVETLIAENTIEEIMSSLEKGIEQDIDKDSDGVKGLESIVEGKDKSSEYQRAKVQFLLRNLKLISNSNTLGFAAGVKRKVSELDDSTETKVGASLGRKKRSTELIVRFQEQEETYEYDLN
mmetsp:Transcript_6959/g.11018  ORF Transcript_6959/g.11018 Transcript_6959/m.11018 type:complete len:735 (+) Transcript_6959:404-2608(+)